MGGFVWYPGKRRVAQRAFAAALAQTAQDVLSDLKDSGTIPHAEHARAGRQAGLLQESGRVDAGGAGRGKVRIVFDTIFARNVYFHPKWNFTTEVNPHPQGLWFEPYLRGGRKANFAHEHYMRRLREHGRGWLF